MEDTQPGQVIAPQSEGQTPAVPPSVPPAGAPVPERPTEVSPVPSPPPPAPDTTGPAAANAPATAVPVADVSAAGASAADDPAAGWQFHADAATEAASGNDPALPGQLTWTASEFIAHEKSAGWYLLLTLGGVAAAVAAYFLTKDKLTTGVVIFAAIAFGIFAARKPSVQSYTITRSGLLVGQKMYDFQGFKSFSVAEDGAIASVVFMPLKRFMPPLTVYLAPEMEEQIVDFLAQLLPFEHHRQDAVDGLLKRIRF